jgi:predicted alpha/beta superfamily hydrolase
MLNLAAAALAAVTLAAAAPDDPGQPIVIGRGYDLPSAVLHQTRRINVYLPPDFAQRKTPLPVVYLLDGGEPEDFHHISGLAQLAALDGQIGEFIVVGIADIDRKHELTHPAADPADRKLLPTSGGSAEFRRFIAQELQPWVKARYGSGPRVLMGESLAGLFVVETFLKQPGLFDAYVAVSPSVWWDKASLTARSAELLATHKPAPRRLFLTNGNEGPVEQAAIDALVNAINARPPEGLELRYQPMPAESHGTIFHPAALAAVRWLFPVAPQH